MIAKDASTICNVMNGLQTIIVMNSFSLKWAKSQITKKGGFFIYLYCSKTKPYLSPVWTDNGVPGDCCLANAYREWVDYFVTSGDKSKADLNGKVVGRVWCDKIATFEINEDDRNGDYTDTYFDSDTIEDLEEFEKQTCLYDFTHLIPSLGFHKTGFALYVKPKSVEFLNLPFTDFIGDYEHNLYQSLNIKKEGYLTDAPKNWRYILDGTEHKVE